ncbi:MAG: DUF2169 domain-containing protein [Nannocystaceae bacterium]
MELVNQTPIAASITVGTLDGVDRRCGFVTAKATFVVGDDARVRLDGRDPFPIFDHDQPTPLGLLPSDRVPRRDPALEVIVLGRAHGGDRSSMIVDLEVGAHRRELQVTGDRTWETILGAARIGAPASIGAMPLTWERAYGGSCECWIDAHSVLDLEHPWNRLGRGFDAEKLAVDLGKAFKPPRGYPRLDPEHRRRLPNLEDPRAPIERWADEPRPYCWATVPTDVGAHLQRPHDRLADGRPMTPEEMLTTIWHRAHPDWIVATPPRESDVTLRGMTPRGLWRFRLPPLRILADYELGDRGGTVELAPHLLMLLPEESRFYLVYRRYFTMVVSPATRRSLRLRLAEGWFDVQGHDPA